MKFLTSQLMATLWQPQMRQNLSALLRYLALLLIVIAVYAIAFHFLMVHEGQAEHSWVTGVYWTLTVMTTLGFGDITFHSDLGRAFSILVLMSGVILLLIVLPFAFIRYFYAPWIEAQIHLTAPRSVSENVRDHVIICRMDSLAEGLIARLKILDVPYVVIEPDPAQATKLHSSGRRVIAGEWDNVRTYASARATMAQLVVANLEDTTNTNITLTVREHDARVPVVALAEDKDAMDIHKLAGASHVIPVKHWLGAHLAARVSAGSPGAQVIGRFHDLAIAELSVNDTPFAGKTIRETRLRQTTGLSVIGYWQRGQLKPARGDAVLGENAVAVIAGADGQIESLNAMFPAEQANDHPVIVIGGGKVGRATMRALKQRDVPVCAVDQNPDLKPALETLADRVVIGNAAEIAVMRRAGIEQAPSAVLTTHEDATNIYLTVYCRQLNPECHIVSRIMHDRNLEAIYRAGADFVLGETSLGVRSVLAVLQGRELVIVGEEVDVFVIPVPESLAGRTLAESAIGARTGLNVIGIQRGDAVASSPRADTPLEPGTSLLALGTNEQRRAFARAFES